MPKHLVTKQLVEQGTPRGVMRFRAGLWYPIGPADEGELVVSHEARVITRRVPDPAKPGETRRETVEEYATIVPTTLVDKIVALGLAEITEE
jgi:hypothetical protein